MAQGTDGTCDPVWRHYVTMNNGDKNPLSYACYDIQILFTTVLLT